MTTYTTAAFVNALCGDVPEPLSAISPLGYLETLVRLYEKEHDWQHDEDPTATREAIDICKKALADIRAVLTDDEQPTESRARCPECNGTGQNWLDPLERCSRCEGEGIDFDDHYNPCESEAWDPKDL